MTVRHAPVLALCLAASLVLLAACGGGAGGTGTGETPVPGLQAFGATAAPLCQSALAPTLGCSAASAPGSPATDWVDSVTGGQVRMHIEGNAVSLQDDCVHRHFDGVWGAAPGSDPLFFGTMLADGSTSRPPAALMVALDGQGGFQVRLINLAGVAIGPPITLRRSVAGDPPPTACPA
ncbi:hypothetical protein BurJ1DRAFT_0528 [Burkholderiales bacterium JOSHI_001]|nr:hypothetical protein BurJ1DRAFT_0528 [Burkholderiales bacterium JOSHI_001]